MANNSQQSQAVATQKPRSVDVFKSMINADSVQEQFNNALGKHKDAFVASLIDLYVGDKQLQTCKPQAIIAEALRAATMNLPLNKALGFAYIVVFNNSVKKVDEKGNDVLDPKTQKPVYDKVPTPTFVPGYKGYEQLAMRTGQYRFINEGLVYEGEFKSSDKLSGMIDISGEKKSDKVVGYFAYFRLLNNMEKTIYMTVEDMAKYAKRYAPSLKFNQKITVPMLIKLANEEPKSDTVGWLGNFNDMGVKTCLRRLLSKHGYLSVEMIQAFASELDYEKKAYMERNEAIAENANATEIDTDDVDYEEVGSETGEVKNEPEQKAPKKSNAKQQDGQDANLFNGGDNNEGPGY